MTTQFSIIIPVYNAERTLRRCLDSLLIQENTSAELLLINDGSTDSSPDICLEYAKKHPNIRVFSQENLGVSSARNLGLSHSHITVGRRTYQVPVRTQFVEGAAETADTIAYAIHDQSINTLWSKVYLREIIEQYQVHFDPALCIDEDITFTFSYAIHVSSIQMISDPLYYFCVDNPDSLSRKHREYLQDQLLTASRERLTVLKNSGLSPDNKQKIFDALAWLHYRRVYSIATELLKSHQPRALFRNKLRTACTAFEKERVIPRTLSGRLIRLPIQMRLTGLIRLSAQAATLNRKRRLDY